MKSLRIIIADDHPLFREGMEHALHRIESTYEVFQAANEMQVLDTLDSYNIDLIFLDIRMPGKDGIEITRCIRKSNTRVKIIGVSMIDDRSTVIKMIQAGANGFLHKNIDKCKLQQAIEVVLSGRFYFSEEISEYENDFKLNGNKITGYTTLSQREIEVLILICKQYSSKDIAKHLFLTEKTVETHRVHLMMKTKSKNVVGLTVYAIQHGYYLPEFKNKISI